MCETGKNGASVTTGDHQDITGMIVLALIALAALIFIAVRRRRNNH